MGPTEMRALVDRYIDAYNRKDVEAMLSTVHADVEFKNVSGGVVNVSTTGMSELRTVALQSLPLFAERHQEVLSFATEDTHAVATIAFRAVVACDIPGGPGQGQVLSLQGRSEFEFADGAISKITDIS